jgi:hypothetical protein
LKINDVAKDSVEQKEFSVDRIKQSTIRKSWKKLEVKDDVQPGFKIIGVEGSGRDLS